MRKRLDFESFQLSPLSNRTPRERTDRCGRGGQAGLPLRKCTHSVFFQCTIPPCREIRKLYESCTVPLQRQNRKNEFGVGLRATQKNQRSWLPQRPGHFSYVNSINRDKTLPLYYLAICCKQHYEALSFVIKTL